MTDVRFQFVVRENKAKIKIWETICIDMTAQCFVFPLCLSRFMLFISGPRSLIQARSAATAEIARDANDVKRTFKVTEGHPLLCQSTRHI